MVPTAMSHHTPSGFGAPSFNWNDFQTKTYPLFVESAFILIVYETKHCSTYPCNGMEWYSDQE